MDVVALRRAIHSTPELAFHEFETSSMISEQLQLAGYTVRAGIAETGLLADFGSRKPRIAIRSDMDALAITEVNNVNYRSRKQGFMHACGHDAHMACVTTAAHMLAQQPDLRGSIRVIMQPAEEDQQSDDRGSKQMIRAGALEGVDAILGLHVDSTIPTGRVGIVIQPASYMESTFEIKSVSSKSDHVTACGKLVAELHELSEEAALHQCRIQITDMRSTTAEKETGFIITGSIAYQSVQSASTMITYIEECCDKMFGSGNSSVTAHLDVGTFEQHERVIETLYRGACTVIGESNVMRIKRKTWTKNFADYTQVVPGAFMLLGAEIRSSRRTMHSPAFDIDENCLQIGASVLAEAARQLCEEFGRE